MKRSGVEAVLLAAGYSSRMGELKPLLPLGKTTVIRRQVEMLQSVANRIIEFRPDGTICDRLGTYDEYLEYQEALKNS